jgi:glycosyltransferase involved in cell wall biosynthesis
MKISVITPTWQRHDLLFNRCIPSVCHQSVEVEHVVSSDGPDPYLAEQLAEWYPWVVYVDQPEHSDDPCNYGARARNRGLEAASGDLIAYVDDDNALRPQHVERLAAALAANPGADFAYSQMFRHGLGDIIGSDPPTHGTIDSSIIMHRKDGPARFGRWPVPAPYEVDWVFISSWLQAGAAYVFVPELTVDYYYRQ